jgi:cysteinyl-tRNA synthetase
LKLEEPQARARASASAAPFIDLLLQIRGDLRKAKQWALADRVRDELKNLGVVVEDSPQGSSWRLG